MIYKWWHKTNAKKSWVNNIWAATGDKDELFYSDSKIFKLFTNYDIACRRFYATVNHTMKTVENLMFNGIFHVHTHFNILYSPRGRSSFVCSGEQGKCGSGSTKLQYMTMSPKCSYSTRGALNAVLYVCFKLPFLELEVSFYRQVYFFLWRSFCDGKCRCWNLKIPKICHYNP